MIALFCKSHNQIVYDKMGIKQIGPIKNFLEKLSNRQILLVEFEIIRSLGYDSNRHYFFG